ncbi:hypothetical protein ISCGN_010871 [Ixodes scapularis]
MVGLITVTGCGRAAFLGARARQMHLPHLAIVNQNCEHMASFFGDRDSMFASYIEVKDVEVIITRMKEDGFTHILVLYDEKFALYGLELLKRQAERTNLTLSFLRLIPDWNLLKKSINTTFVRQAEKNSFYTGFGVLVFSNYTCAEKLEADLISENIMDPNIVLVIFFNGWDQNLSYWYYTHGVSVPYEKLIYVIVRSFPKRIMHRMKRASRQLNGKYHVVSWYSRQRACESIRLPSPLTPRPAVCRLRNSGMVGLITVTGCGRAAFLGARARQMHLPHLAIVNQNCEHMASFFGDRDSMFASYIEVKDVEVIITRMKEDGFTHILVLYDEKFALYGLELLKRQAERTNLTLSFLRLIPDWNLLKKSINTTFVRQAEKNSFYTGFGVLVFSNYTCAEKLEADLISENIMDPNIVLVIFFNGWDQNLSYWYYTHGVSVPYEKLIYVIVRSFPKRIMHRMKRASRQLNGKYHVYSYAEMYALNFVRGIISHLLEATPRLSNGPRCDSSQDIFYETCRKGLKISVSYRSASLRPRSCSPVAETRNTRAPYFRPFYEGGEEVASRRDHQRA